MAEPSRSFGETLEHPSASVSVELVIALLNRADWLLAEFSSIARLADHGFPSAELLGWFEAKPCWRYVMRLRADTWVLGTAAPMGCQVRRLRLPRGHCRGFRDVSLWAESIHRAHLLLSFPTGLAVTEPWYLVSNADLTLDLVWAYGQRFCCEQLFRDQKSGISNCRAVAYATRSASIGCCWSSPSLCWSAVCRAMP